MTFQHYENDILVATRNMSSVRSGRLPLTFSTQSGYKVTDEKEHLVSEDISNLDTCECSLGLFWLWRERKCFQATEKSWCTELLISYGSALTSTPNFKHLEKLHSVLIELHWLHFPRSAPINYGNVLWPLFHSLELEKDYSTLPIGDTQQQRCYSQGITAQFTVSMVKSFWINVHALKERQRLNASANCMKEAKVWSCAVFKLFCCTSAVLMCLC